MEVAMRWGLFALVLAGCESGVTIDLSWQVPEAVASGTSREAPGVLLTRWGGDEARPAVAVCGEAVDYAEYFDDFGCKPDRKEELLEAWVVPMPATWDPALCDEARYDDVEPTDPEARDLAYPVAELPAPTDADPYGSARVAWKATPICGGILRGEVVVTAP
ncbi:MAG: hypothetical protein R2724_34910 [Bryobacterales bacterium]